MGMLGNSDGLKKYMEHLNIGKAAYDNRVQPIADIGMDAYERMGQLMGISGNYDSAMEKFYNSPGIQYQQDMMQQATQRQLGAAGYNYSGNMLAELQNRSQNLASTQFNSYLGQLATVAQPGLTAQMNLADMDYNYNAQIGALKAEKSSSGWSWEGAIGGAVQGFATGGWWGAAAGAVAGGVGGSGGTDYGGAQARSNSSFFGASGYGNSGVNNTRSVLSGYMDEYSNTSTGGGNWNNWRDTSIFGEN
jgi:hypothetical protein